MNTDFKYIPIVVYSLIACTSMENEKKTAAAKRRELKVFIVGKEMGELKVVQIISVLYRSKKRNVC